MGQPAFNGATANSPWRTTPHRARPGSTPCAFNGATANSPWRTSTQTTHTDSTVCLQWGHGEFAVENGSHSAPPTTWKLPSMGPRRIRRGEHSQTDTYCGKNKNLQWGHGEFAVENATRPPRPGLDLENLQWGHGEFAVENLTRPSRAGARWTPFNGATANSPWRTAVATDWPGQPGNLQWGHGEFAVENHPRDIQQDARADRLQWGHGEFAVENFCLPPSHSQHAPAFNGATANSPWRTGTGGTGHSPGCAFNGATANSPWRTMQAFSRGSQEELPSMGPRRIRRGELLESCCNIGLVFRPSMGPRRIRRGEPLAS